MIKRKNILSESKISFLEKELNKLQTLLDNNNIKKIEISRATSIYLSEILEYIGKEYDQIIVIVPDAILGFGKINVYVSKYIIARTIEGNQIQGYTFTILGETRNVVTKELDEIIAIEKPEYLIMNKNTLSLLFESDKMDNYSTAGKAHYHSYMKIPIAISEFLDPGTIDIITK